MRVCEGRRQVYHPMSGTGIDIDLDALAPAGGADTLLLLTKGEIKRRSGEANVVPVPAGLARFTLSHVGPRAYCQLHAPSPRRGEGEPKAYIAMWDMLGVR